MAADDAPKVSNKYSVLDLTLDQIASIEDASGIPFGQWGDEDKPRGKLDALMWAAFTGEPVRTAGRITMRGMIEARNAAAAKDSDPDS